GVSLDGWREDSCEQVLVTRMRRGEVDEKIQGSVTEVNLCLEEMKAAPAERVEYHLSHILVRVAEQASRERLEAARAKAEKALAQARAGGDFGKLAASYSDAADALQGGSLGWRTQDRLPELFAATLLNMNPGEVSPVL